MREASAIWNPHHSLPWSLPSPFPRTSTTAYQVTGVSRMMTAEQSPAGRWWEQVQAFTTPPPPPPSPKGWWITAYREHLFLMLTVSESLEIVSIKKSDRFLTWWSGGELECTTLVPEPSAVGLPFSLLTLTGTESNKSLTFSIT